MTCSHQNAGTFTADGADHTGLDLFVKCKDCGLRGPHVECERSTPRLRNMVWNAWHDDLDGNFINPEEGQ